MEGWLSMVGMGTWLMYYWKLVVGDSDFALRSISAIAGIALILVVAEFTRRFHDEKAAIITASMLSISHLAILYSQEFRPYMFTTTFIWIAFLLMRSERRLSLFETIFGPHESLVHYEAPCQFLHGANVARIRQPGTQSICPCSSCCLHLNSTTQPTGL